MWKQGIMVNVHTPIHVSCTSVQTSIQTLTLCPTWKHFVRLGSQWGPTQTPLWHTVTWELSGAVGWVVLDDARPGPCQRAAADWYPVLRGFGRQMLAGKSPFVKCVAEYVKKLGNCVLPHEYEQKFGKAAREAIKYWSGYHFSSPNTVLCFPFLHSSVTSLLMSGTLLGCLRTTAGTNSAVIMGNQRRCKGLPVVTICSIFVFISHTEMPFSLGFTQLSALWWQLHDESLKTEPCSPFKC